MLREERFSDLTELFRSAAAGLQARLWTAMPCIIQSVNYDLQTCQAQIAIMMRRRNADSTYTWVKIEPLLDCPLFYPSGGGFTLTFPVAAGDEGLAVFASRCIDQWWQGGGVNNRQAEIRFHDLSDGFVFAGFRSNPRALGSVNPTAAELRSDDGSAFVQVGPGKIVVKAAEVVIEGTTKLIWSGGTVGRVYTATEIDTYETGIPVVPHVPPAPTS